MLFTFMLWPMWDLPVHSSRSVVTLLSPSFPLSWSQSDRSKRGQDFCWFQKSLPWWERRLDRCCKKSSKSAVPDIPRGPRAQFKGNTFKFDLLLLPAWDPGRVIWPQEPCFPHVQNVDNVEATVPLSSDGHGFRDHIHITRCAQHTHRENAVMAYITTQVM